VSSNLDSRESIGGVPASEADEGQDSSVRTAVDGPRVQRAVREILLAIGEDPDREGLRDTPARVAAMYGELFGGLHRDPRRHLRKFFAEICDEVVLVRDIGFNSMCEHHFLPFMGKAHVAYLPGERVIGLSKLARVVEEVARRPQVQERMTEQIANLLVEELHAKGVAVVIEAVHTCMTIRGVGKPGSVCVTSAMKGCFRTKSSTRAELMTLIYGDRR
jgi:GTP cyclohydrolase IA